MNFLKTLLASALVTGFAAHAIAHDAVPNLDGMHEPAIAAPQADISGATGMVFTAVEPCRLLDTRVPSLRSGRLPAQGQRDFLVYDADLALEQGGAEGGCDLPDTVRAVAINLTAVGASGRGFVTAWDYGSDRPGTATINLIPGEDVNNQLSVAINTDVNQPDLMVYSFASTHLVADIVGYYTQPAAQALDCVSRASDNHPVAANSESNVISPSCPAGYARTGGSCVGGHFHVNLVTTQGADNFHFCASRNSGGTDSYIRAEVRCCRVSGN